MAEEWAFLERVHRLLCEEQVLPTPPEASVVDFHYPHDLAKIIDVSLDTEVPRTLDEAEEMCRLVLKYSVKTGHRFFCNQLFGGCDPFGLAGSWITDALNTSQYTFEVGPVFTLIEDSVVRKCLDLFNFPSGDGIFSPGGSMSNMYAMILARFRLDPRYKSAGMFESKPLVAFTSQDAHYSIKKAAHWMGIGLDNLETVATDDRGRMRPDALKEAIERVKSGGRRPFFVNATAGTTVLGAFDDLEKLADVCEEAGIWLHVDACLGGSAILSQRYKGLLAGSGRVDSLSWNPHKTLGAPLQCSILLAREKNMLHKCNCANADYLFQQDKFYDISFDTGDKSFQCGRKVDAFKLWLMMKVRGIEGLGEKMDNAMEMSQYLTDQLRSRPGFRLVLDEFQYTNICFWYIPKKMRDQEETQDWWKNLYKVAPLIKEKMVKAGSMMVGFTPLLHKGIGNFFRMVITCQPSFSRNDIDQFIIQIEQFGNSLAFP
ncbi:cysteine sulfinic acid decarboxylase [Phlebotomus argentipes]|uniref:cysteine sulfinic acid decarboxylase n=1 Tax=Phlebotomus argentipes TaxID=94469 RepID=UPI002892F4B2|nr:cysteine sulfinic acid decarboxylase [Phlebotomus argentipes]